MRLSDIAIGMRVRHENYDAPGAVVDIDPEDPGHEFLVAWDNGGQIWIGAADLEPEGES